MSRPNFGSTSLFLRSQLVRNRRQLFVQCLADKCSQIVRRRGLALFYLLALIVDVILCLENREECYTFFEDVCTVNELLSLSQRFEVAKMLREQKTYLDIAEKTGASTATISRVNRSLNYGNDGYDMVFSRMKSEEK